MSESTMETLTALKTTEARLADLGARITALLAADVEEFFVATVRERFVAAPPELEPSDEVLRRVKRRTEAAAAEATAALRARLEPAAVWTGVARPAEADPPLTAHPVVAEAVAEVERRLADLLRAAEAEGLPAGEAPAYRLPVRFIGGESLPVLTRNYWKAVARRDAARSNAETQRAQSTAEARRRRWDEL